MGWRRGCAQDAEARESAPAPFGQNSGEPADLAQRLQQMFGLRDDASLRAEMAAKPSAAASAQGAAFAMQAKAGRCGDMMNARVVAGQQLRSTNEDEVAQGAAQGVE